MEGYTITKPEYYIISDDEEEDNDHNVEGHSLKEYKELEEESFLD